MEIELTPVDRLTLINQYKILQAVDPKNRDRYEELIEIVQSGYTSLYRELADKLSDNVDCEDLRIVTNTLHMYTVLGEFFVSHPEDQSASHSWATFKGFDGNNESELRRFALFLVERQGRFTEQQGNLARTDHFDSHKPCRSKYEAMLSEWERQPDKYKTTSTGVAQILNARPS